MLKALLLTTLLCATAPLRAGDNPASVPTAKEQDATLFPIPDLTSSIWKRERLLGDVGGPRQTLAEHGVQFNFNLTQFYQGVMSGGETDVWASEVGVSAVETLFGGILDQKSENRVSTLAAGKLGNSEMDKSDPFGKWTGELMLDTHKMGMWPGGFFFMRVEGNYGQSVNGRSGSLMPTNTEAVFPKSGLDDVTIPHFYLTQFLSEHLAVAFGKLDTAGSGDLNVFAQYPGQETFLNTALVFNPVYSLTVPYSPLGAAVIVLPTKDLRISLSATDGDGSPTRVGTDTVFSGRTSYSIESQLTIHPWGKTGHQLAGFVFATGGFKEMNQSLSALVPASGVSLQESSDTWCFYYNFDQFLWTRPDDPERGWGVFGRVGFADKKTNPIEQSYSVGLGGKGCFASRPHDRWGAGFYYTKTSDDLPEFLKLANEQGGEVFYNFAVTPAFMITADLQVVDSAREDVDTAFIGGMRTTLRF